MTNKQSGSSQSQRPSENPKEKEGGLAPIARLILEEGFRNEEFSPVVEQIRETSNRIFRGENVSKEETDAILAKIEAHKNEVKEKYSEEVADIMINYFTKLEHNLEASLIKSETPKSLDELKKTV